MGDLILEYLQIDAGLRSFAMHNEFQTPAW